MSASLVHYIPIVTLLLGKRTAHLLTTLLVWDSASLQPETTRPNSSKMTRRDMSTST